MDQRGQGSTAAAGAIAPRVVWPDGCLTAAHRVPATPVPVKHAFAGSPAAVRRRGVGVEGNIPDRSPLPRRLQERTTPATRPSAGAHRLALGPPLARASRVPQVALAGSTFTTPLPRHRTPSCASGGASRLVESPEGTRGSRTARGHEMPGLLLHFYEVDAASLTYAYHHQFVIYKKIVACRLGQAYPDGQRESPSR